MNEMAGWFETQATTEHKNVLAEEVPEVIDFDSMDDRYWPMWLLRKYGGQSSACGTRLPKLSTLGEMRFRLH